MVSNSFQQTTPKRRAAWLALLAILLIVVAPLISVSLQKDPMSAMPGMHHAMMMDSSSASMAQMPGHKIDDAQHRRCYAYRTRTAAGPCRSLWLLRAVSPCPRADFRAGAVRRHAPAAHSPAGFSPGIKTLALLSQALPRNPRPAAAVCFFPFIKINLRTAQRPLLL